MAEINVKTLDIEPYFDMELFMSTSQETRIGGEVMERLERLWDEWATKAKAVSFEADGKAFILVWLDESIEEAIDSQWEDSPSESFRINALAQVMCMSMIHAAVPEVQDAGCAPAPKPTTAIAKALKEVGIPYSQSPIQNLERRYAVLTYYPFRGGCEICDLLDSCPKGSGESLSVTLPGHEDNENEA